MSVSDSAAARRQVLLCGYYGEHNLGDDALLQVLLSQLPRDWRPVVTAHDQELVRRRFSGTLAGEQTEGRSPLETVDRRSLRAVLQALGRCDALVLGGGSLLQDSTSFRSLLYYGALIVAARSRRTPILLWAQGLGPLRRLRSRVLARLLLGLASGITWRDPESARLAAGWGIRGELGSDPVWAVEPCSWQGQGGPIVLCWRPVHQLDEQGWRLLLRALEELAERLDRPVHWLPFHQGQDSGLLEELAGRGLMGERLRRRCISVEASTPEAAMEHFRGASLVVAMRLHGLILAALAGSPCAALSYDPKVAAAAAGLGCPCLDLGQIPQEFREVTRLLSDPWEALVDRPPDPARLGVLRDGTRVHGQLLQRLDALLP